MTDEELQDLVGARLLAKIDQRFPGGRGLTPAAVRPLLEELLDELEREGVVTSIDAMVRAAADEAIRRLAFAVDGDGVDETTTSETVH
jgi:hypothetical protein